MLKSHCTYIQIGMLSVQNTDDIIAVYVYNVNKYCQVKM